MLNTISLQLFSFIYVFVLSIVYFSKRKYNFIESNVYKVLLIFTMVSLVLDGINTYLTINNNLELVVISKLHHISLFIWLVLFTLYVLLSRSNNKYESFKELFKANTNLFLWISITSFLFALLIVLQLWANFLQINNAMYEVSIVYWFGIAVSIVVLLNILLRLYSRLVT